MKKHNYTLLYVEDDAPIRQQAIEYLAHQYTHLLEASNGYEALELYRKNRPDIIIADIEMPELNGLEMAQAIRCNDKKTPIIIATAYTDTHYLLEAVELQLVKYIIKPITALKLQEALELAHEFLEDRHESIVKLSSTAYYDLLNKTLMHQDSIVKLTHNELLLLDLLCQNPQRIVTYEEIESAIWSYEGMSMDALRSLMRSLRKKLQGDCIENLSGVGYRIIALS